MLTTVVIAVFFNQFTIGWLAKLWPHAAARIVANPMAMRLASGLARLQKVAS
jgi:hypothetical protein